MNLTTKTLFDGKHRLFVAKFWAYILSLFPQVLENAGMPSDSTTCTFGNFLIVESPRKNMCLQKSRVVRMVIC